MTKLKRTTHKAKSFSENVAQAYCLLPASRSAIAITNRLTGSQFRLWHYLMMIDSFADCNRDGEMIFHDIPSPTEIGEAIGSNPRTVEKDMKRLEELGLYAKRVTSWQGYNLTAEEGRKVANQMKQNGHQKPESLQDKDGYLTAKTAKQPEAALNNRNNGKTTAKTAKQPDLALNNRNPRPEPLQNKDSSVSQTIQTYTDFKKTLSDKEREKFLNFVREKIKDFSPQINEVEGWLAKKNKAEQNRWSVYYDLFRESQPELVQASQNAEWENHPQRNEWLAEIESTSNPAMFAGSNKERQGFVSWCWKTKQFSWLKEEVEDGI